MPDFDRSGIFQEWSLVKMGPTIGAVQAPSNVVLPITAAGTVALDPSFNVVTVNVAGAVTITLPFAADPSVPAGVLPGLFINNPITILDVGGHATANPITVAAQAGELIAGQPTATISVNYGSLVLIPNPASRVWIAH
jgi:hypothetical protein